MVHVQIVQLPNDASMVIFDITETTIKYQVYKDGFPIENMNESEYTISNGKCDFDNRFIASDYFLHLKEQRIE
jgi:hypothetical protein